MLHFDNWVEAAARLNTLFAAESLEREGKLRLIGYEAGIGTIISTAMITSVAANVASVVVAIISSIAVVYVSGSIRVGINCTLKETSTVGLLLISHPSLLCRTRTSTLRLNYVTPGLLIYLTSSYDKSTIPSCVAPLLPFVNIPVDLGWFSNLRHLQNPGLAGGITRQQDGSKSTTWTWVIC
ncbi:hypothetical protein LIA77_03260 [Sarocladium implicatum]|nr:hypothetical protein LIA77_03260 [Sarocladium implicatum]